MKRKFDAKHSAGHTTSEFEQEISLGKLTLNSGKIIDAKRHFHKALTINPQSLEACFGKAVACYHIGERQHSKEFFLDYLIRSNNLRNNSSGSWLDRGKAYYFIGYYYVAWSCFTEVLKLDPNNNEVLYARAKAAYKLTKLNFDERIFETAIADFNQLLQQTLKCPEILFYKAKILFKRSIKTQEDLKSEDYLAEATLLFQSALSYNTLLLKRSPINVNLLLAQGNILYRLGHMTSNNEHFDESLKHYDKALALEPQNTKALLAQVRVHTRRDNLEAAEECYDRALESALNPKVWLSYGIFLFNSCNEASYPTALDACKLALFYFPNYERALEVKCNILRKLGKEEEAREAEKAKDLISRAAMSNEEKILESIRGPIYSNTIISKGQESPCNNVNYEVDSLGPTQPPKKRWVEQYNKSTNTSSFKDFT
jgi:tetratricopeptide (TPR) repeat protein